MGSQLLRDPARVSSPSEVEVVGAVLSAVKYNLSKVAMVTLRVPVHMSPRGCIFETHLRERSTLEEQNIEASRVPGPWFSEGGDVNGPLCAGKEGSSRHLHLSDG